MGVSGVSTTIWIAPPGETPTRQRPKTTGSALQAFTVPVAQSGKFLMSDERSHQGQSWAVLNHKLQIDLDQTRSS
jgi:hypothetical protein